LKTVLFLVFFSLSFTVQGKYLSGEGEFLSITSDSSVFIKKQLIFSAQKNILNDYLTSLDLSPQQFWQGFETSVEKKLETKISWFNEKIEASNQSGNFDSLVEWETKKRELILKYKANYFDRSRVFNSFSILSRSQSLSNPSLKFIKMKVKISKPRLKSLFFKLTKQKISRVFKNLYVFISFKNSSKFFDQSLEKTNLYDEKSLNDVSIALQKKWESFLKKELVGKIENIKFIEEDERDQLDKFLLVSPKKEINTIRGNIELSKEGEPNEDNSQSMQDNSIVESPNLENESMTTTEQTLQEESERKGDLYLKITVDFKKAFYNKDIQKGEFLFSGGMLLFDLSGGNIVLNKDFKANEKVLFSSSKNSFYSSLATKIYNHPLDGMRSFKPLLSKYPSINNRVVIKINSPGNMNDIFTLREFLSISGANFNFKTNNFISVKDSVFFDLHFNGEKEDALNKFRQWESKNIGGRLMMTANVENENIEISLNYEDDTLKEEINEDDKDKQTKQSI
jgi:hypothetical protein